MKNKFTIAIAVIFAVAIGFQTDWAQKTRELRTIEGNYNDTATIAPTVQRIKSLKLPAGFQIAKFAEICNEIFIRRKRARKTFWAELGPECGPETCVETGCNRLRIKLAIRCLEHQFDDYKF